MSTYNGPDGLWEFEPADESVGIFGDSIVHCCDKNPTYEEAIEGFDRQVSPKSEELVEERTTYTCPKCGAQTVKVEQYPAEWFKEPSE